MPIANTSAVFSHVYIQPLQYNKPRTTPFRFQGVYATVGNSVRECVYVYVYSPCTCEYRHAKSTTLSIHVTYTYIIIPIKQVTQSTGASKLASNFLFLRFCD